MSRNSLKYELNQHCLEGAELSDTTIRNYKSYNAHFRDFCMQSGINTWKKLESGKDSVLNDYAAYLKDKGYSSTTIHSYLSAPCRALGVKMDDVTKDKRCTSRGSRSSGRSSARSDQECKDQRYAAAYDFSRAVGIRKSEYLKLTGSDLVRDQHDQICVRVKSGKGGKEQLQRILPQYEETVLKAFEEKKPDEKIFSPRQFSKNIDYHGNRAKMAQEAYQYYADQIRTDPEARDRIRGECIDRMKGSLISLHIDGKITRSAAAAKLEKFIDQITDNSPYKLRGDNYDLATSKGKPVSYDRTALFAVSVFHLSHWRLDVTITNYMLK